MTRGSSSRGSSTLLHVDVPARPGKDEDGDDEAERAWRHGENRISE